MTRGLGRSRCHSEMLSDLPSASGLFITHQTQKPVPGCEGPTHPNCPFRGYYYLVNPIQTRNGHGLLGCGLSRSDTNSPVHYIYGFRFPSFGRFLPERFGFEHVGFSGLRDFLVGTNPHDVLAGVLVFSPHLHTRCQCEWVGGVGSIYVSKVA
jgi:hypothetical protein